MLQLLRNGQILAIVGLLVLGIAMAAGHKHAVDANRPFFPEDAVRVVMKPFQVLTSGSRLLVNVAARSVRSRGAIGRENDRLRDENKRLYQEVIRLREEAAQAKRMSAQLGFKEQATERLLAARIISRDASEWFITATIDVGRRDGVRPGQAVVTARGLVGQVFEVSPTSSLIHSVTDRKSGIGAMVQRSRVACLCMGQYPDPPHLTYLSKDADVKPGDIVITSGQGGVIPKGMPIGRVMDVKPESGGFMRGATIRPSVAFDQVEEVFVVLRSVD